MPAGKPRGTVKHLELTGLDVLKPARYNQWNKTQVATIERGTTLSPPKNYHKETKQAWEMVVPNLILQGVLTETDLPELRLMFDCYEEYTKAKTAIKNYDKQHSLEEDNYVVTRKRLSDWMLNCQANFNKIAMRFGMAPTERSRLPINNEEKTKEIDPLEAIIE